MMHSIPALSERRDAASGESAPPRPLGVLGGMGPLVSAEFLKTIYEESAGRAEQHAPAVILHSDPSMPDRTDAFLNGRADVVLARFVDALEHLDAQGVSKIVVCCVTIHYLLPRLPAPLRGRIVSLLDVIVRAVAASPRRHLLLCTTGTRQLRLFESHPDWPAVEDRLVLPDADDQAAVHRTIYKVKETADGRVLTGTVEQLLRKYDVDSFVAGCTEIHFASKHLDRPGGGFGCVDPLVIVARDLARGAV
jgi:aspartate racemase